MRLIGDNEYQHPTSMGSLASAHRCWLSLVAAGVDAAPQHFTFAYDCPTLAAASALAASLRNRSFPRVSVTGGDEAMAPEAWRVQGATRGRIQSLEYLEHLFTALRRTAAQHRAVLIGLSVSAARAA
jgi:hypothetical protein